MCALRRDRDAGNYDKRMRLQEPTVTTTPGVTTTDFDSPATDLKIWCALKPIQGNERWWADQVQSQVTHRIYTWWRSDISPTPAWRLLKVDDSRVFQIESVIDVDEAHEEWEFRVVEATT